MASSMECKLKCYVCEKYKKAFICKECISSGDFASSKFVCGADCSSEPAVAYDAKEETVVVAKFKDKESLYGTLEEECKALGERFDEIISQLKQLETLEQTISEHESKVSNIKNLIKTRKSEANYLVERLTKLTSHEETIRKSLETGIPGMETIRERIAHGKTRLKSAANECEKIWSDIKKTNKENLLKLKNYIFPVSVKDDMNYSETTCSTDAVFLPFDTHKAVSVDSETDSISCSHPSANSWTNVPSHRRYNIIDPWIPQNSIAHSYSNWVIFQDSLMEEMRRTGNGYKGPEEGEEIRVNDAYRVSAALAHIAQLMSVTSSFVDVRFPTKLTYADFYAQHDENGFQTLFTENEILHKLAKLNANLMYLCLSQNVQTKFLDPTMTGHNLVKLFDPSCSDLGRTGPIYIDPDTHRAVEEKLLPDFLLIESEYFDDLQLEAEGLGDWECVPRNPTLPQQASIANENFLSSIAESCISTLTSFIRG